MLACYEEALKKTSSLSRQLQCLISSRHRLGLVYHHLYCWTLQMTVQMTGLQFKRKCRRIVRDVPISTYHLTVRVTFTKMLPGSTIQYNTNEHKNRNHTIPLSEFNSLQLALVTPDALCISLRQLQSVRSGIESRPKAWLSLLCSSGIRRHAPRQMGTRTLE